MLIEFLILIIILIYFLIPDEGYYQSGKFHFEIDVPEAYNMVVSEVIVCCLLSVFVHLSLFITI